MYSIYTCMLKLHRQTYFDYPIHVLKNPSLIKYKFWFLIKIVRHKNSSNCLIFELKLLSHVYISMQNVKTIFEIFYIFYKIYKIFLTWFSDPGQWLTGQVGRPHGRPNQGPVDPAVDRRAQPCARLADTWAGRPAGRPDQRALLSVSGRSTGRSTGPESPALCIWAVDWAVDREAPMVIFMTVGGRPVGRPPASQADRSA